MREPYRAQPGAVPGNADKAARSHVSARGGSQVSRRDYLSPAGKESAFPGAPGEKPRAGLPPSGAGAGKGTPAGRPPLGAGPDEGLRSL